MNPPMFLLPLNPHLRSWKARFTQAALLSLALLPLACKPKAPPEAPWVLRSGSSVIPPDEMQFAWETRVKGTVAVPLEEVLTTESESLAALEQARRSGFLDQPETRRALRLFLAGRYREHLQKEAASEAEVLVSEAEIRERFAATPARWQKPAVANVAILTHPLPRKATAEKQQEARNRVVEWREAMLKSPEALAAFRERARQNSADTATRFRGGELGWSTAEQLRKRLPTAVADVAWSLKDKGEVSVAIEANDQIFLVQLLGRREPEPRPLAEVEAQLRHELVTERQAVRAAALKQRLMSGLQIETNAPALAQLNAPRVKPPETNAPPAMAAR